MINFVENSARSLINDWHNTNISLGTPHMCEALNDTSHPLTHINSIKQCNNQSLNDQIVLMWEFREGNYECI